MSYDLLIDLVAALAVALAGGWLATRIGLSPIAGYVVAGIVISPFTPGFVGDVDRLRLIADIGVVLLLFGIGVEFSIGAVRDAGWRLAAAATLQTAIVLAAGAGVVMTLGWDRDAALFAGAAVAISSSTVIARLVTERGDASSGYARIAITWAIVQDLLAVALVGVLIAISDEGNVAESALLSLLKAVALIAGMLVVGIRVVPPLLDYFASHEARELFVLAIAGIALGAALVSEWAGLSLAFGAFIAGLVVSESAASHRVLHELLPARDVFGVLFFVSVGMLIDPAVFRDDPGTLFALLALIVLAKGIVVAVLARLAGQPRADAAMAGGLLANAGEFSFVLIGIALDRSVVDNDAFSAVVAATAISIVLAPLVTALARRVVPATSDATAATEAHSPAA